MVVVDNFSSAELAQETRAAFEGMAGVHLLFRPENDGFARGNNAGYRYARETLAASFIAVFNNDVEVLQPDFPERVYRSHRETGFSILGPDIRVADGWRVIHQNPSLREFSESEVRERLAKLRATPDGDGSLLDHMTIMYGSGISNSNRHAGENLPLLLLGGGAGTLKGGRHLKYNDKPSNANLLVTLMDKLGVPVEKLGGSTGKLGIDPLPEV